MQDLTGFLPEVDTQGLVTFERFKLGDLNDDGHVNFADVSPFITLLATGGYEREGDIDEDGTVGFADISGFISLLSS